MGDGQTIKVRGKLGESLLDTARREDIELEGACEGSVACSTCHVVLESQVFDALQEATDEENDMLDLAYGLTQTYEFRILQRFLHFSRVSLFWSTGLVWAVK
jgi:ferredoxin